MAKRESTLQHTEQLDEETAAALALTEAKTRVVLRLGTRSTLWVAFLVLVLYYLFEVVRWFLYELTGVLLVIVLAVFFAYLIAPLVELVRKPFNARGRERVMPRGLAIGAVYLAIFGSLGIGAVVLTPRLGTQMADIAQQSPTYLTNARERADRLNKVFVDLNLPRPVRDTANKAVTSAIEGIGSYVTGQGFESAVYLLGYLPWLILVPILAFFFLKDADSFR
ncbi:MAG: family transporter, partial [Acidobacteriota bacterium]|nr:family transporter [Acidobacteriota bacterium]